MLSRLMQKTDCLNSFTLESSSLDAYKSLQSLGRWSRTLPKLWENSHAEPSVDLDQQSLGKSQKSLRTKGNYQEGLFLIVKLTCFTTDRRTFLWNTIGTLRIFFFSRLNKPPPFGNSWKRVNKPRVVSLSKVNAVNTVSVFLDFTSLVHDPLKVHWIDFKPWASLRIDMRPEEWGPGELNVNPQMNLEAWFIAPRRWSNKILAVSYVKTLDYPEISLQFGLCSESSEILGSIKAC